MPTESSRTVVRVTTNGYSNGECYTFKKTVRRLKRKSFGYSQLESIYGFDTEEDPLIENLLNVSDGVYQLVMCNIYKDCETGYIEDWDWKLIPYNEENEDE